MFVFSDQDINLQNQIVLAIPQQHLDTVKTF